MIDKSQVSCNCFGINNPNQEKFFLSRKRQQQESQPPQSVRRVAKSSEVKNEIDGKGHKKSLKKRLGSFVHSDNIHSASNEANKIEKQIKANLLQEQTLKNKHSWGKEAQVATLCYSNPLVLKFPQTTISAKQPALNSNPKQFIRNKSGTMHLNFAQHNLLGYGYHQNQKNNFHLRPQLLQFQSQTTQNYKPITIMNQKITVDIVKQADSKPLVTPHKILQNQFQTNSSPLIGQNNIILQSQNFNPLSEDQLLIKDFQKLFKNKEENNYNKQLLKDKNTPKPRDALKSKRFQQQHLMGRFVQSEDEDCSQSPPSQVIGKGFDRSYQDFFYKNEPVVAQQTKESRSTNTKVSNMRGQKQIDQHQRTKFGNLTHFTSYDRI